MTENVISWFAEYPGAAVLISMLASVVIAIAGLVPSVFITAANILYFGFWEGTVLSFLGEAAGAGMSFYLYRKGLKSAVRRKLKKYPRVEQVLDAKGVQAFWLIISLRLLPFVPSGAVTLAAAAGTVSAALFIVASTIGKAPALLIEAYSVQSVATWGTEGKIILGAAGILALFAVLKNRIGKP